jgi:hypothetical protein
MFPCSMRRIPIMLLALALLAFNTKCTAMAFQPRPQRATRLMATLRSQHDSDNERSEILERMELSTDNMELRIDNMELSTDNMELSIDNMELRIDNILDMSKRIRKSLERNELSMAALNEKFDTKFNAVDAKFNAVYVLLIPYIAIMIYLPALLKSLS